MIQILEKPEVRQMAMPMTVEQYHRLSAAGIIPEQTELLRGVILEKMTRSPRHVYIARRLHKWLMRRDWHGYHVRKEEPLTLRDSEPEPDLAIVAGNDEDYGSTHPSTAEFIVEVSVSSLALDREKGAVYAAAGVAEFWIVIPDEQAIEVYTSPSPDGYQQLRRHDDIETPLAIAAFPDLSITPRELFA
jgi:Uma2 family endonuclease